MKVLVVGYGVSGKAATAFLRANGHTVTAVDKNPSEGVLSDRASIALDGFELVVLSPGVPSDHPLIQNANRKGIEVIGEIELGMRHLKNRVFGVTGTNGKTSTVLLMEHILDGKGRALGNVGVPLTEYLLDPKSEEILILELSSYQLETIQTPMLEAGFVLNISPNHLDRYESYASYAQAKAKIGNCIKEGGELYISKKVQEEFSCLFPNALVFEKNVAIINTLSYTKMEMPSKQSLEAAYLLCTRCGVTDTQFLDRLKSFRKPEHRIEWVDKIDGVSYYNDSKSSNVQSVIHAVNQLEGPLILIVGGVHKGSTYKPWIEAFGGKVRKIIAYGKAAPIIECELASHFSMDLVDRFADAVQWAKIEAKNQETVLLSPGCSSFDQFDNYKHRGVEFKRLVRET